MRERVCVCAVGLFFQPPHDGCCSYADHIAHFDSLKRLLPKLSEEELLDALSHVSVSVRGRLLVKRCVSACAVHDPSREVCYMCANL